MVVRCAAPMCSNSQDKTKDITYHRFPKDVELQHCVIVLTRSTMKMPNVTNHKDCVLYFLNQIVTSYLSSGYIRKDAIPSNFYWTVPSSMSDNQKDTSSTNICEISAQNIDEENVLDLPDPKCSAGIAVCSTPILGRTHSSTEMTNISNISRVTCTSPTTDDQLSLSVFSSCSTQTPKILSRYTSRKIKLKEQLTMQKEKYESLQVEFKKLQKAYSNACSLSNFNLMCDKFLTPEMSNFVKLQSKLINFKNKGRRYTDEFKQFALTIWFFGPKVYRFLKFAWCLPTIRTLQKVSERWEINTGFNNFVFEVLKLNLKHMSDESKQCVIIGCVIWSTIVLFRIEVQFPFNKFIRTRYKEINIFMIANCPDS
ncbi:hypothetical protein AGLY_001408 [Aphis glycines]|uniref:THAP-type domain-containing protein n=1 Tax=Aphis glycines TaxID=307491 RepID=A0A6G0U6J0_APHGL|nr:hypothetical protein AGLY_001408 [Aphis glycines]